MGNVEFDNYVIELRRAFHAHPELSLEETLTSARICQELKAMGIPFEIVGDKNVIGVLQGSGEQLSSAVAVRADFDALPIEEKTEVPWKSQNPGCMHACGHDAHAAILLGAAKLLKEKEAQLPGKVYLCFQQGEEVGAGASECVEYLKAKGDVKCAFGAHMMSILPSGILDLEPGLRATGAYGFHIEIQGRSGHGARPDLAVSALEIACELYQYLIKIPSNHLEAARTCVVSPCVMKAGNRANVIPETAVLEGTVRFNGEEDGSVLTGLIEHAAQSIVQLYGGQAEVTFQVMSPYPIVNTEKAVEIGCAAGEKEGFCLMHIPPTSASDNFSEFLHAFSGFFCFIGSASDREGTSGVHHAPNFDLDESVLPNAARFIHECAIELLKAYH